MSQVAYYRSPVGLLKLSASQKGITAIQVLSDDTCENTAITNQHLSTCIEQLKQYFSGDRKSFSVAIDIEDAPIFYQDVWKTLLLIPYGKTRSYLDVAKRLGNPKSVRAVGLANAKNPIPFIVPCHRVIGKNGSLVGYAQGLRMKQHLLHLENPDHFNEQGTLFGNVA